VLVLAAFWQFMLAIHIAAVVVGFGVTFAYPVVFGYGMRLDPSAMPWFHRVQARIGRVLINPSLAVIFLVGIYLASHLHQWDRFYVWFGVVATLILGALGALFFEPRELRLAELAERDVAAAGAGGGKVVLSREYLVLNRQVGAVATGASLLVLLTVLLMSIGPG
jgi:hypothetical protein